MRRLIVAALAALVFAEATGSALAFDPSAMAPSRQPARGSAAVAYFRLPFNATGAHNRMTYGLALTAPTPRSYGISPLSIANTPKLLDLAFDGAVPDSLSVTGRMAWARDPSRLPDGRPLTLIGGLADFTLGVAGTALAVYLGYLLVKEKCPAISTTSGACITLGN